MGLHASLFNMNGSSAGGHSNETGGPGIAQVPINLLESFIPGYSVISKFILDAFGLDITLIVSVAFLAFALGTTVNYIWRHAHSLFRRWLTASITVPSDDALYDHMMRWLAEQQVFKGSRSLLAVTANSKAWDDDGCNDSEDEDKDEDGWDTDRLVNFADSDTKVPPRYEPSHGQHYFWHKGHYFTLRREMQQLLSTTWGSSPIQESENLYLTCIGRSTAPIKALLEEARDHSQEKERSMTVIRRPGPKHMRSWGGRAMWMRVATRPSRPMETVVLDHAQKKALLADINEYLHPATPRWYATRGIPYRRGYLFSGPPGTGKTSLSFALAGIFGLGIFVISLLEPTLSEEDLGMLFNNLPRRCIVLLEDIDSAGLKRKPSGDQPASDEGSGSAADSDDEDDTQKEKWGIVEVAKALKSVSKKDDDDDDGGDGTNANKKRISLSGLLNAIDGVASHEGRVLVMTTNHPDKLDEALIRPGRIDMQIEFSLATQTQMRELFVRMYMGDERDLTRRKSEPVTEKPVPEEIDNLLVESRPSSSSSSSSSSIAMTNTTAATTPASSTTTTTPPRKRSHPSAPSLGLVELETFADGFASQIPDSTFTPAEIQGFLLVRKKEPRRAVEEVGSWRDTMIERKKTKKSRGKAGGV